jgi:hypothetical protein
MSLRGFAAPGTYSINVCMFFMFARGANMKNMQTLME